MHININENDVAKSIDVYGKDMQTTVCMEECSELIQAISKSKRGKDNLSNIVEEMADVLICLEILKQIYNVSDALLDMWVDIKQSRNNARIEEFVVAGKDK